MKNFFLTQWRRGVVVPISIGALVGLLALIVDRRAEPAAEPSFLAAVGAGLDSSRVSSSQDRALIQFPTYSTNQVTNYLANGSKQIVRGSSAVKDFLKQHIDLEITGLGDYASNQIVLRYQQATGVFEKRNQDLYQRVATNESAFLHGRGLPPTKENRLIHRSFSTPDDPQYVTDASAAWAEAFVGFLQQEFASNPRWDGVFLDVAVARLVTNFSTGNSAARFIRHVTSQPYAIEAGADRIVVDPNYLLNIPPNPSSSDPVVFANQITVRDQSGTDYYGGQYDERTIFLKSPLATSTTLYASYDVIDEPDQAVIDSWPSRMGGFLSQIKQAFPNKLVIFNGIFTVWTEDDALPALSDGGMSEDFIYAPWDSNSTRISLSKWQNFVSELQSISADRIYLAQSGVMADLDNSGQEAELKKKAMFAFSSFLLGKGPYGYFNFAAGAPVGADQPPSYQNFLNFAYWDAALGRPLETYHARTDNSAVYQRDFEQLTALVNPSSGAVTLALDPSPYKSYWDPSGTLKTTVDDLKALRLEAGAAVLLVKRSATDTVVPVTTACVESWSCSAWSVCTNNRQTRTCTDQNSCGTTENRPRLNRTCTPGQTETEDEESATSTAPVKMTFQPITAKLSLGETSPAVRQLQEMLYYGGFYQGQFTGHYGPLTETAVAAFQTRYGIPTTPETRGFAGPVTRAKLNELYADPGGVVFAPTAASAALVRELQLKLVELMNQLVSLLKSSS